MAASSSSSGYIGMAPFGVQIDQNTKLQELVDEAKKHRALPFDEKLVKIKELAIGAMRNAFDLTEKNPDLYKTIVYTPHSLGEALDLNAGCCRYQSTLFFILGMEAELGDEHLLRSAQVGERVNTCFNTVIKNGVAHDISIFCDSLKNKKFDYTEGPKPHVMSIIAEKLPYFKGFPIRGSLIEIGDRKFPYKSSASEKFFSYIRAEGKVNTVITIGHERI